MISKDDINSAVRFFVQFQIGGITFFRLSVNKNHWERRTKLLKFLLSTMLHVRDFGKIVCMFEVKIPLNDFETKVITRRLNRPGIDHLLDVIELVSNYFQKYRHAESDISLNPPLDGPDSVVNQNDDIKLHLIFKLNLLNKQIKFVCSLDPVLPELLPPNVEVNEATTSLIINPRIFIQYGPIIPRKVADRFGKCFPPLSELPTVWVEGLGSKFLMPFTPSSSELDLIKQLLGGKLDPNDLPSECQRIFILANIIGTKDFLERKKQQWTNLTEQAATSIKSNEYAILRNILNPLQIAAYRSYFRKIEEEGFLRKGDARGPKRHIKHNEILAKSVHAQLETLLNSFLPIEIKKSYCYLSAYKSGAVLEKHTDRPQCQWNLSMIFDMEPEKIHEVPWPIYLEVAGKEVEVQLHMGDAVIYRGTDIPHWRHALSDGHETTAVFFHFVDKNFKDSLN